MSAFYVCCTYSSALQTRFYHGSKQYEPWADCSQGEQSDLGPYGLQCRQPKNISRREQTTKVVTGGLTRILTYRCSLRGQPFASEFLRRFKRLKMSAFYVCCTYSSALQTRFYHGSKQYEPWADCSQGEQSDLGPYGLQCRQPKNISRREQTTKVVTGGLTRILTYRCSLRGQPFASEFLRRFKRLKMSAFYVCCTYSSALQTRFYHGSKQYEPSSDCFQREQSDLGPYCLQCRLPKNISRREQTTKVVTGGLTRILAYRCSLGGQPFASEFLRRFKFLEISCYKYSLPVKVNHSCLHFPLVLKPC